jgi:acetate kinase
LLGIELDESRNRQGSGDREVSPDGSAVRVLTLATNEELVVARRVYRCLTSRQ